MAPIKFEERLKDKLEKRRVTPSANSWSQLNDRLDADEKTSKKPIFWWVGIAAGLLILMAVTVQFFNMKDSEDIVPQMVEDSTIEKVLEDKKQQSKDDISIELAVEIDSSPDNLQNEDKMSLSQGKSAIGKDNKTKNSNIDKPSELVFENRIVENENVSSNSEILNKQIVLIDTARVNQALSNIEQDLKNEKLAVTDREIDSLLKMANKELFKEKLNIETLKTVDADALLESVEDDMGVAYRGRVFRALKGSYKTIKTAVVNRNN